MSSEKDPSSIHDQTAAARAGHHRPQGLNNPASMPIVQAAVFEFSELDDVRDIGLGKKEGFVYSRVSNPTVWAFEEELRLFEHGDVAIGTGSGMGAIFAVLGGLLSQGDHVVLAEQLYGVTYALVEQMLKRFGVQASYVNAQSLTAIEAAFRPETKLCYIETISNPLLEVSDIAGIAKLCATRKVLLAVDNTFATPLACKPLTLGADVVLHSATKYLGGHSDVTAGVVVAKAALTKRLRGAAILAGSTLDPHAAWLLLRGLKTLSVRFTRQQKNAQLLAERLAKHAAVARTYHSALGAVVSFELRGDVREVLRRMPNLPITPSLGGTVTTMAHPASMSHGMVPPAERARLGISDQLIRVSVGIEHIDDVWAELDAALR